VSREVEELNRRLLRARDLMDRAYSEPPDVRAVAAAAHLSGAYFTRSFRAAFGETPHRYLQRRRVERAMFLLRETERSVTEADLTQDSILVVNAGSSSLKLSVLDAQDQVTGAFELDRWDGSPDHDELASFVAGQGQVAAAGHRVVHGGSTFTGPVLVDDGDRVALVLEDVGQRRADPPASHDHNVHDRPLPEYSASPELAS